MKPRRGPKPIVWVLVILAAGGCLCIPVLAAILLPVFSQAKASAQATTALNHTRVYAAAIAMYSADNNDQWPPVRKWHDVAIDANPAVSTLEFPELDPEMHILAFNQALARQEPSKIASPESTVLLFEIAEQPNANAFGDPKSAVVPGKYNGRTLFAFADGSAKAVRAPE